MALDRSPKFWLMRMFIKQYKSHFSSILVHIVITKLITKACQSRGDPEGGVAGGWDPALKNHKTIGFLSNTSPDHIKIHKLPSQYSMLGHYRQASETPFTQRDYCLPIKHTISTAR